jgi:hypothetical protein
MTTITISHVTNTVTTDDSRSWVWGLVAAVIVCAIVIAAALVFVYRRNTRSKQQARAVVVATPVCMSAHERLDGQHIGYNPNEIPMAEVVSSHPINDSITPLSMSLAKPAPASHADEIKQPARKPRSGANQAKPVCKYGAGCYRNNPEHLEQYYHPQPGADQC